MFLGKVSEHAINWCRKVNRPSYVRGSEILVVWWHFPSCAKNICAASCMQALGGAPPSWRAAEDHLVGKSVILAKCVKYAIQLFCFVGIQYQFTDCNHINANYGTYMPKASLRMKLLKNRLNLFPLSTKLGPSGIRD